jgi:hypothetical protein
VGDSAALWRFSTPPSIFVSWNAVWGADKCDAAIGNGKRRSGTGGVIGQARAEVQRRAAAVPWGLVGSHGGRLIPGGFDAPARAKISKAKDPRLVDPQAPESDEYLEVLSAQNSGCVAPVGQPVSLVIYGVTLRVSGVLERKIQFSFRADQELNRLKLNDWLARIYRLLSIALPAMEVKQPPSCRILVFQMGNNSTTDCLLNREGGIVHESCVKT